MYEFELHLVECAMELKNADDAQQELLQLHMDKIKDFSGSDLSAQILVHGKNKTVGFSVEELIEVPELLEEIIQLFREHCDAKNIVYVGHGVRARSDTGFSEEVFILVSQQEGKKPICATVPKSNLTDWVYHPPEGLERVIFLSDEPELVH